MWRDGRIFKKEGDLPHVEAEVSHTKSTELLEKTISRQESHTTVSNIQRAITVGIEVGCKNMQFTALLTSLLLAGSTLVVAAPDGTCLPFSTRTSSFIFTTLLLLHMRPLNADISKHHCLNELCARNHSAQQDVLMERTYSVHNLLLSLAFGTHHFTKK